MERRERKVLQSRRQYGQSDAILQWLDLDDNKISAKGAKALAEALKGNTALQELNLPDNKISDAVKQQIETDKRICC